MLADEPYDPSLVTARTRARTLLLRLDTEPNRPARAALLRDLLGHMGEGTEIRGGFACDYGGNIRIGAGNVVAGSPARVLRRL